MMILELGGYSCQIWDHYLTLGGENRKCISESFKKDQMEKKWSMKLWTTREKFGD